MRAFLIGSAVFQFVLCAAVLTGCPESTPNVPDASDGGLDARGDAPRDAACPPHALVASRAQDDADVGTDARETFAPAERVTIPETLDVLEGRAGDGSAYLSLRVAEPDADRLWATCIYRGQGARYGLDFCDFGLQAGSHPAVEEIALRVLRGDPASPKVTARAVLGERCVDR